jgi:uncharacterized protein (DUF58 family)
MRPARPLSPMLVSVMVLFVWWIVAHNSGSGWVQVLGDAVFGMLLVGLFGPAIALARLRVELLHSPSDAAAGLPVVIEIGATGRARVRPVEPKGPESLVGRRRSGSDHDVTLLPDHRGVYAEIVLDVATAAPFGLQWWTRRVALPLPATLHVAPRLGQAIQLPYWVDDRTGAAGSATPAEAGDARGVRDYRPGDRRRRVHWGATAHAGRLMVREMEEPSAQPVILRVALPADPDLAERTAECALATTVKLLDRGVRIELATMESGGEVVRPVADRREAGRRLARATGGPGAAAVELLR